MLPRLTHALLGTALIAVVAIAFPGCDGASSDPVDPDRRPDAAAESRDGAPAGTGDSRARPQETEDDDASQPVSPSRQAIAAGRRFEALVAAYTPVSTRINFLVAAETLRRDAVESAAGDDVERERFGAVRVEIVRMRVVLDQSRPRVAAVAVTDTDQQHVKDLMLAAIDARRRALARLEVALDHLGGVEEPDARASLLIERWEEGWNESLRLAREATTRMQDARARLRLAPALEESIR